MAGPLEQQRHHGGHHHHHGHGHGHGHGHKHDNTYLVSANKKDPGVRITRLGLYVNCVMALSKAAGGYLLNSQALLADAFHSMTDLVSDCLTLGTVAWSLKSPTERFPSGYGKIESLGSLGVSSLLLVGGVGLGLHSVEILYGMWTAGAADAIVDGAGAHHGRGHSHGHGHGHGSGAGGLFGHSHSHNPADMGIPNVHAAWIAAASIIIKEYLYRATIKIAKERKSSILASNAIHHRIDSLTSIVALTAILGSNVLDNVSWLDPVGGLLVSIMVVRAGWGNTGAALLELADVGLDHEMKDSVRQASSDAIATLNVPVSDSVHSSDAMAVSSVRGIKAGQSYLVDIEVVVPDATTIQGTKLVEDTVRQAVGAQVRGVRRVRVKFIAESQQQSGLSREFVRAAGNPSQSPEEHTGSGSAHDSSTSQPAAGLSKRK